ncbi:hypothetical protein F8564_10030 [Serratia sp. RJAL6]|nr:hypothetical protein F8564_10030 [Enterobacter sp. RJAL6]
MQSLASSERLRNLACGNITASVIILAALTRVCSNQFFHAVFGVSPTPKLIPRISGGVMQYHKPFSNRIAGFIITLRVPDNLIGLTVYLVVALLADVALVLCQF